MTANPYYHPEDLGLTPIDSIDDAGSYEFHILAFWRHTDGRCFYASDSGCSCPTPFEHFGSLADLTTIQSEYEWDEFAKRVQDWSLPQAELDEFLLACRKAYTEGRRQHTADDPNGV
jgi:hypothetical protein